MASEFMPDPMSNESALLGAIAEWYRDRAALLAENVQLRADVQRLETALDEMRTHAEPAGPAAN